MQAFAKDIYIVVRVYRNINSSVIFTTMNSQDAVSYADIMKRNEPDSDFAVAKVTDLFISE